MVNKVIAMAKRDKMSCMVLKVDFEKVYDSVSWNYLRYLFNKMDFGDWWYDGWKRAFLIVLCMCL